MHEELVIAKAFEIACNVTNEKYRQFRIDKQKMFIDQKLYDTFVTVLRFIKSSAARNISVDDIEFIYTNETMRTK